MTELDFVVSFVFFFGGLIGFDWRRDGLNLQISGTQPSNDLTRLIVALLTGGPMQAA